MTYRLERRNIPDLAELFADIGRAKVTVGQPRSILTGQSGLTLSLGSDRRTATLTVEDPPGDIDAPIASRLEGCDVVFSEGEQSQPPVRIQEAEATEDPLVFTIFLARQVPSTLSGSVTLYESSLSQAWREVQSFRTYLENVKTYLSYPARPSQNRIAQAANRLKAKGFSQAASAILDTEFEKWI